jgi:hypothetical protein
MSPSSATDNRSRCSECGRVFKDIAAHMLTHQEERPEKCPIETCEYHTKGFARKYDKNRHALTHYKGNMVCPFCPGPGTAYEKAFNRADVFKRHLTSVHHVEQTAPSTRGRIVGAGPSMSPMSPGASSTQAATDRLSPDSSQQPQQPPPTFSQPTSMTSPDRTATVDGASGGGGNNGGAKCSICGNRFAAAQDFYEHLDDCVLSVLVQPQPGAASSSSSASNTAVLGQQHPAARGLDVAASRAVAEDSPPGSQPPQHGD